MNKVVADRVWVAMQDRVHLSGLESLRSTAAVHAAVDAMARGLVVTLTANFPGVLAERLVVDRQWPRDWWQALRERFLPAWWLRRWPVQYETLHIDKPLYAAVCPHVHMPPEHSAHVHFLFDAQEQVRGDAP